jgi:hypothetical protein
MLYCERETYNIQNFPDFVDKIDKQMYKSLGSREEVESIWDTVKDVILERLTRKPRRKRPAIS